MEKTPELACGISLTGIFVAEKRECVYAWEIGREIVICARRKVMVNSCQPMWASWEPHNFRAEFWPD